METDKEKEFDALLKKFTREIPLETPSPEFNTLVISKIKAERSSTLNLRVKPIFSTQSWVLISITGMVMIILSIWTAGIDSDLLEFSGNFAQRSLLAVNEFIPKVSNTRILMSSAIALIASMVIQIFWLKKSWSKKQVIF